jgi:hypothetical protein
MDLPHEDQKTKSATFTSGVIAGSTLDPELLVFFEAGSRVKLSLASVFMNAFSR